MTQVGNQNLSTGNVKEEVRYGRHGTEGVKTNLDIQEGKQRGFGSISLDTDSGLKKG